VHTAPGPGVAATGEDILDLKKNLGPLGFLKDISRDFASHRIVRTLRDTNRLLSGIHQMSAMNYVDRLLQEPRFNDPLRLHRYGFKGHSQFDEDGIIEEILRRIGITTRRFVEFGAGDGLENNTLYLLCQGWQGLWLDRNEDHAKAIREKFRPTLKSKRLVYVNKSLTRENLNDIVERHGFTAEIDVLSIDVDGNDYHIWEAVEVVSPRVVVIEYNAKYRPPVEWVMDYNPKHVFDKTDYCGASLKSLELLGTRKGYKLVGCGLTGANAFFVRDDIVADKFLAPFTAEEHYEPARYILAWQYRSGMASSYGPFLGAGGKKYD